MELLWVIAQFVLMGGICYLLLIRPDSKRRKTLAQMQKALTKGDRVVTNGGLRARVHTLDDKTVTLITDEGVKLNFDRQAVMKKID